jgi:hypothetical protein
MSSDPFDLLELDRATATDADVRRAYAAKLKVTRPEDDRAGFMALRAAFERARNEVRWRDEDAAYQYEDEDEQDHSPPDAYGQSSAETGRPPVMLAEAPAPDVPVEPPIPDETPAYYVEDVPYDDDPPPTPAEIDYDRRLGAVFDRLVDLLTKGAFGAAPKDILRVIDHTDVAGIEEYQSMQWKVRDFVCDRTGFNTDPQELRLPDWLTVEVFDALDGYYGWTRQPTLNGWTRRLNDWLVRVRDRLVWAKTPRAIETPIAQAIEVSPNFWQRATDVGNGSFWLWVGAGILISQLVRFFASMGGG